MSKRIIATLTLVFMLLTSSQIVFADSSLGSTEPNNTFDEATQIQRNNANHPDEAFEVYLGKMNTANDIDIFKVYLPAGDNTLIVQPYNADLRVTLFNSNEVAVLEETFSSRNRQSDFNLQTDESGFYYVHITTERLLDTTKTPSYRLVVGNPYYSRGTYTQRLTSLEITSSNRTSSTIQFDLRNVASIPNDAIVDSIRYGGQEINRVYGRVRSARPIGYWKWFDGREFWFEAEDVSSDNLPILLKERWEFRHSASDFGYTKSYTLTPEIYFNYFYQENLDE